MVFEYVFDNERWHVIKFGYLQRSVPIELTPALMAELHEFGTREHAEAWQLLRLIYGARKMGKGADVLGEVCESVNSACAVTNISPGYLKMLLSKMIQGFILRKTGKTDDTTKLKLPSAGPGRPKSQRSGIIPQNRQPNAVAKTAPMAVNTPAPAPAPVADKTPEISAEPNLETMDKVLAYFKFSEDIFDCDSPRSALEKLEEQRWFCDRLKEIRRIFDEPMTKGLARQAVINELLLRRTDVAMTKSDVSSEQFASLQQTKTLLEQSYRSQWDQIDQIIPYASAVQSKTTFAGVISDVIKAVQKYKQSNETTLIDGIFTKYEIEILMRQAEQHEIRYRPSLTLCWLEAKRHLWDANYKSTLPVRVLKLLDAGFREGVAKVNESGEVFLPDLEKDGPEGEYFDLGVGPFAGEAETGNNPQAVEPPKELPLPPVDNSHEILSS